VAPLEIKVEGLYKAFDGHAVLTGIDLTVARGELVAIVGGSGSGKTVLVHHVIGHHRPDRGRVLVADHETPGAPLVDLADLDDEGLDRIRVHSAVVFQRNALFSGTVYENIALWLREIRRLDEPTIRRRARASVDIVGFRGDPTILEKHRDDLSGGMAKRVAVARALAMEPLVLYYDEPTTGLDPVNAAQIHELILRTHERRVDARVATTTIVITHDKDLLTRLEPRIVMLHDGRVYFDGPFDEFARSTSPIIRPYFETMPLLHQRPLAV